MTLVAEMADRGENPAESPYNCVLEVGTDDRTATIVWTESLRFHAEYNGKREYPAAHGYPAWSTEDRWTPLVDANGFLTVDAEHALAASLSTMMPKAANGSRVFIDHDGDADEPAVRIELTTDYAEGETYEAWLDRIGWPIVATLINVTDPGTWNSPYLFDASQLEAK